MRYPFLIYGSYGYTGSLVAALAVQRGLRPLLAGRDAQKLSTQARELGLDWRAFPLDDASALETALSECDFVLHIAGPYHRTTPRMAEACLRIRRHYLDITGELRVFETLASQDERARQAGVMLLPGMGYDVVPTDCLALHLKQHMPEAVHLSLATRALGGGASHGTLLTVVESLPLGGALRQDGRLVPVPYAARTRQVDFGRGPRELALIPLGDLVTAFHTTGIPNIETYTALPRALLRGMRLVRPFVRLTGWQPVQRLLRRAVLSQPAGPTPEARHTGRSQAWGEVVDAQGRVLAARLELPETYHLTALTLLRAAEKLLAGEARPGFQTPAGLFGADFILEFEGVSRMDLA
jgi:short subunit dehydrogenase-like uncharacterized protein